jgi:hypothetical protein
MCRLEHRDDGESWVGSRVSLNVEADATQDILGSMQGGFHGVPISLRHDHRNSTPNVMANIMHHRPQRNPHVTVLEIVSGAIEIIVFLRAVVV